jgi:hypothetical protein
LAVVIWVTSPHSPTNTTAKLVAKIRMRRGGTAPSRALARLAAGGHRVVIAVATDGAMGEATAPGAQARLDELRASALVLGVARVA